MLKCTKCQNDISDVEVIERTAKSGKNAGSKYKARICSCGTFNFVNEEQPKSAPETSVIIRKLDQILEILHRTLETPGTKPADIETPPNWEE